MVSSPSTGGVYAVSVVLGVVAILFVALRFIARRLLAQSTKTVLPTWRWDDWLTVVTTCLLWGLAIILIYGASRGTIGTHTRTNPKTHGVIVTPHENEISKFGAISQILSVLALGALKSAVVLFYRRIFVADFFRKASLGVLVFLSIWTLAFFLATVLQCKAQNLDLMWKSIMTFKSQCQEYKSIQLAHCVTDVATDLVVLALPLREIWFLHMQTRQKITVSLIFLIGLLSTAAGTARLVIVAEDIFETTAGARDVRGVETNVLVWTFVEVGVGIVAACLPTLRPLRNARSIDSIIASVRSKVSLHSLDSSGERRRSDTKGTEDVEQMPYAGPVLPNSQTKIAMYEDQRQVTERQGIRREDSVTVKSETLG